jgi:hypothetical protein
MYLSEEAEESLKDKLQAEPVNRWTEAFGTENFSIGWLLPINQREKKISAESQYRNAYLLC